MKILTQFNPSSSEIVFFEKKLFQHNSSKIENYGYDDFILTVTDRTGFSCEVCPQQRLNGQSKEGSDTIIAGIHCQAGGGWLYISSLWIDEKYRHQGLGKTLLTKAEDIAVQKKCRGAYLYTYSFQSRGFYEKLGYHVFGSLEDFCGDHTKFYMKKNLV